MKDSQEGRRIHALAEDARESGDFLKALKYTDQATLQYQKDGDLFGLAEVQSSRQSTFKHLCRETGDEAYLLLEEYAAQSAVAIAERSGMPEALAIPYHNLGKYYYEAKQYEKAANCFRNAVENLLAYPNNRHARPSVIADIKGHQFAAEYHTGDHAALDRALQALDELITASDKTTTYARNAWISGAHIRIAEMLAHDNPALAREQYKKAKTIIDNDPQQILRKKQLAKLAPLLHED